MIRNRLARLLRSILVTGQVAQIGENFTVQAELVKVTDGTQLWGQRFTRKLQDASLLQGDIAQGLASRLGPRFSWAEKDRISTSGTRNPEAYVKGRFFLAQRCHDGVKQAITSLQHAAALDSSYADAYASRPSPAMSLQRLERERNKANCVRCTPALRFQNAGKIQKNNFV